MIENPHLPSHDFPKIEWAGRAPTYWLWDFERENFLAKGHPTYGEKDVEYRFNSQGFRTGEFSETRAFKVIAIGCSYVFGFGLPHDAIFHSIIAERLRNECGLDLVLYNLGFGGASNDYISRILYLTFLKLRPDLVLINFTHTPRREYLSNDGQYINFLPGVDPKWSPVLSECHKHYTGLYSKLDDQLNAFRNYKAVETLLQHTSWFFSFSDEGIFSGFENHVDWNRYAGSLRHPGKPLDYARDNSHPGPLTHARLARQYWDKFLSQGFLEKLKER